MRPWLVVAAVALSPMSAFAQTAEPRDTQQGVNHRGQTAEGACAGGDTNAIDLFHLEWRAKNCIVLKGGFSEISGSFVGVTYSTRNVLRLGEILSLNSEYGARRRRMQFGFDKPSLFRLPIHTGFTIYGQRFHYNQARESSVFAFQRDIPAFSQFPADDRLDYVSYSYGGTVFAQFPLRRRSSEFRITYSYDVADYKPLTDSTSDYFPHLVNDIRTSKLIPSFSYSTLDNPINPTHGRAFSISTGIAGLGGNINSIEPALVGKYFRSGFKQRHVIGMRLQGRLMTGYGGKTAPTFDRYYIGGEQDVRGFDSWSISPVIYVPGSTRVNVLNSDGSPLVRKTISADGTPILTNITMSIPIYRIVSSGGDTNVVMNFEYRIPIGRPFTLAFFTDAGVNRLTFRNPVDGYLLQTLRQQFPEAAGFNSQPLVQPGTQKLRMSNGVELQVLVPRIKAPVRFYGAYNPLAYRGIVQGPLVADLNNFPNLTTFLNAVKLNTPVPLYERRFMLRFSIGRTFGGR